MRARLGELVRLARIYRGWSKRELGRMLRRDPSRLVPESGLPKIDLVVDLAAVLEWPVEWVIEWLWSDAAAGVGAGEEQRDPRCGQRVAVALEAARIALRERRWEDALDAATNAARRAADPGDRAIAALRRAEALAGRGRHDAALAAIRGGLEERAAPDGTRLRLRAAAVVAQARLGASDEAVALGSAVAREAGAAVADPVIAEAIGRARLARAEAIAACGAVSFRLGVAGRRDAIAAERLLRSAARSLGHRELDHRRAAAAARVARATRWQIEVAVGMLDADRAVARIESILDVALDPGREPDVARLEAHAAWCLIGCAIALAGAGAGTVAEAGPRIGRLTNKADEIAERLDDWPLRARLLEIDFLSRRENGEAPPEPGAWALDEEDLRSITGAIGRCPGFRATGRALVAAAGLAPGPGEPV